MPAGASGFVGTGADAGDEVAEVVEVLGGEDAGLVFESLVEAQVGTPAGDEAAVLHPVHVVSAVDLDFESDGEHVRTLAHGAPCGGVGIVRLPPAGGQAGLAVAVPRVVPSAAALA